MATKTHPENVTFDEIDSFPEKLSKFFFPCYRQSKYGHSKQIWMFEVPPINSLAIIRYLCTQIVEPTQDYISWFGSIKVL